MTSEIKIMLVDDDASLLLMMRSVLEQEGYKVDSADCPLKAVELFRANKYHIVITDISMPEMSGLELLMKVRNYDPLVQVIVITGMSTMENALSTAEKGAAEYLLKPMTAEKLLATVKICEDKLDRWKDHIRQTIHKKKG